MKCFMAERANMMQAFVLYPFCDRGAAVDNECPHCVHYQLRSLSLRGVAGSTNASTCVGLNCHGTSSYAPPVPDPADRLRWLTKI